jgi:hypothetical protein
VAHRAHNDYGIRFLSPGGAEEFEPGIEKFRSKIDKIGVDEIRLKTVAEVGRDLLGRRDPPNGNICQIKRKGRFRNDFSCAVC